MNVWGVGTNRIRDWLSRLLSVTVPWIASVATILVVGLVGWGAGALTRRIFDRFIGFYIIVWIWSLLAAMFVWVLMPEGFYEPLDPGDQAEPAWDPDVESA